MPDSVLLSTKQVEELFPCFLHVNPDLTLRSCGRTIIKLYPHAYPGTALGDLFSVERPATGFDPERASRGRTSVRLASRDGRIRLAGGVMETPAGFLFYVTPVARDTAAWADISLTASDFSLADQTLAVATAIGVQREQLSEMKALSERLSRARDEALAASAAKSEFLSVMSHEIRTPLNGMLGMAQALAREIADPRQRAKLDVIRSSGEALLTILNDVLDLSKIEAGRIDLDLCVFDPVEILKGAQAVFASLAAEKGLGFHLDLDPLPGFLQGDPQRVRQIVFNLISNAVKFTQEGHVRLSGVRDGEDLVIAVTDTGIGISPDKLNLIFEKFGQADSSISRRFGGTGLGLSISSRLAQRMGGAITVESALGRGSTFTLRLPLPQAEGPASAESVTMAAPSDLPTVRILAAEDNATNQLVLKTLLAQVGVEPVVVESGEAAIEAWTSGEQWDAILMDIQMPGMGGLEAARRIREAERTVGRRRTPIIAFTANAMTHQSALYLEGGMDRIVAKPVRAETLFNALSEVLAEAGAAGPTPDAASAA